MGLFGLGKKKITETIYAPVNGKLKTLENVNDPVFAQKLMGDGFGVVPAQGNIYSPVEGIITSVFKTKHALGLKTSNGLEVMVHMGLDTVELAGKPFEILVEEGDKVKVQTPIAKMDLEQVRLAKKDTIILTIITNTADKIDSSSLSVENNADLKNGSKVMEAKLK
ncbi:PTS sugar transporter subunit IIA [Companilactobacillus bobalius]|uniref:Protein-N(Pi)-phosphohistidine--sugar phosphotransferase n=2 Tax=Companilactobacillus bobalius TaxID=2801451 RepID=A0A202FDN1_9LACO|nr:PTS glucose transporter subunit IIA [Companilactobacillus bobalius]KAE9556947.1 sugar permease [Companilactobacillus bobalius]KRK81868.1 N-acetylglucosamine and glucose PTS, EIICBA [Companilactobacillus bobalius DSM 19674]OVE98599.1 Protein-N(pi)-phosphohistidine--sugar phosphotransferase [Companilactobacillus bobalius]GEO59023.1 PTS N-acetylglucosamine transporter subunit IIABC [Companilactobacillus paralimentarius]